MGDYEREERPADFLLPDSVRTFVQHLYTAVLSGNIEEMRTLYRRDYSNLTNSYYKNTPWPEVDVISNLVDHDPSFLLLYKEMYFRHLFANISAQSYAEKRHGEEATTTTIEQRIDSWTNYCALFDSILDDTFEVVALSEQWSWDIIGEFVYQFQASCQYRAELSQRTEDEKEILRENETIWQARKVLSYMRRLINKSRIREILQAEKAGERPPSPPSELLRQLGYFSIIGLNRAQVLLCDYYGSLRTLAPLSFASDALYTRVTTCHIPLFYHLGVAQMMTRRYVDAVKTFNSVLVFIVRNKNYHQKRDQVMKLNDRMLALLAIVLSICPARRSNEVDDQIMTQIKEKYGDKFLYMQRGDLGPVQELFRWACPKFVVPTPHSYDDTENHSLDAYQLQVQLFMEEVAQQQNLPTLRSYLKLYRTIDLQKLARFRDTEEDSLRQELISFKHKTYQLYRGAGATAAPHEGEMTSALDVKFYLDMDMIHIEKIKAEQRHGVFFMNQIKKFRDIERDALKRRF